VPVVNYLLYEIEGWLVKKDLVDMVIMSGKATPSFFRLISILSQKQRRIVVKSYNLGPALRFFDSRLVLDVEIRDYKVLSKAELGLIMWTLVCVSALSPKAKNSLKFIVPKGFPVDKKLVS
jgi:hypothetical protein